jgi:hypothetical protein
VLVIVDGLRLDASKKMKTLDTLRGYGADITLEAPQPSLSYPNWTTLLSGAQPEISGVVTNWHEGVAPVETIFDTAKRAGVRTVFVGPDDFETLYGVKEKTAASYMKPWDKKYLTAEYVDAALRLAKKEKPQLVVMHLPDIDEAGHDFGAASPQYAETLSRVDADMRRLVEGLSDAHTTFVVVADHGHLDTGGHGGWETEVTAVPGVLAGRGVGASTGVATSMDIAPTVALLAGIPAPRNLTGAPAVEPISEAAAQSAGAIAAAQESALRAYTKVANTEYRWDDKLTPSANFAVARASRLKADRSSRIPIGGAILLLALAILVVAGIGSWRALVAALAGAIAYYVTYNGLFFIVHGYQWSLSAFNSEDLIQSWMNGRMIEAVIAGVICALVAGAVYPLLRRSPKAARGSYLAGWLTLGPLSVVVVQATLLMQVAWFVWGWGVKPTWSLPDLKWGFKYDLDLVQLTALGVAALLAPLVTFVIGRYHPRTRRLQPPDEGMPGVGASIDGTPPANPVGAQAVGEE